MLLNLASFIYSSIFTVSFPKAKKRQCYYLHGRSVSDCDQTRRNRFLFGLSCFSMMSFSFHLGLQLSRTYVDTNAKSSASFLIGIEKVDGFLRQRYKILCIVFSISQCINQPWLELSSWTGHCKSLNIIVSSSTPCKEMLSGRIHRSMNIFYVAKMESEEDYIVKAINLVTKADTAYNRFLIIRDDVFIFILKLMQLMHQHVKESGDKQNILSLQNENLAVGCILNQYQMDQLRDGQTQFFSMYFTLRENVLPGTCGNQRIVAHFVRTNLTPLQLKRCPLERPVLSLDSHVGLLLPAMKSTRDKHIFVGNIKFFSRLF